MNRRHFITLLGVGAVSMALPLHAEAGDLVTTNFLKKKKARFPLELTDAEWKKKLSPEAYEVLRKHGTERSGSSPLNREKRNGVYHCAGCGQKLFASKAKFESGSGWPSFYEPIAKDAVGESTDFKIILPRTEIHCANCGGHLGHVFDDGPAITGKRYCMNGVALSFKPVE
jgi:peptide-methionine (R)-S-oxide reductase